MGKISDEIRNDFVRGDGVDAVSYRKLLSIADRIDSEMVELPKTADGVPIRVGDTVYLSDGRKGEVSRITLAREKTRIDLWMCDEGNFLFSVAQRDITHAVPDSWERIARNMEDWAEGYRNSSAKMEFNTVLDFAERIRRLAERED